MRRNLHPTSIALAVTALLALVPTAGGDPADPSPRWWKGNLHTHSFWSDGNDFPEMIASWYAENGYHFLTISDHNVLSRGQRWMPMAEIDRRSRGSAFPAYVERFGRSWVETREGSDGAEEVRLKPFDEYRALVEQRDGFMMMEGEEISAGFGGRPIHMNATNLGELIPPPAGSSVADVMRRIMRAANEQAASAGRPILVHLNHPNFGWAITAEDMAEVVEERYFEVFNGHTGVNNLGREERPSTEAMWDIANTLRIAGLDAPPLYGIATDDSHSYHGHSPVSVPGRAWVMVLARRLTPASIIGAMERGEFYASTGVELESVDFDRASGRLSLRIAARDGVRYVTRFVGTRRGVPIEGAPRVGDDGVAIATTRRYDERIGMVLAEVEGPTPSYDLAGDELYVRAVVTSDASPAVPSRESEFEKAWTQPVGW